MADAAYFPVLTSSEWARNVANARAAANPLKAQIQKAIEAQQPHIVNYYDTNFGQTQTIRMSVKT